MEQVTRHWRDGYGGQYNPSRKEALTNTRVCNLVAEAIGTIERETGERPQTIVTDARTFPNSIGYGALRETLKKKGQYLILFGTGWGLDKEIMNSADYILDPIAGVEKFNHLPVRSAIAIILDRLLAPGSR